MAKQAGKKKFNWGWVLFFLLFALIGAGVGVWLAWQGEARGIEVWPLGSLLPLLAMLVGLVLAIYVQIILHEAGHLVFGLLSGYRFSSFRIGSLMWVKVNGHLRLRRLTLAGTGGQCLMVPPQMVSGRFPHVLYNLGGALMNILSGLVFLGLYFVFRSAVVLSTVLLATAITGFLFALMNGIPLRLGMVENDGHNALSLRKHPQALRAFWLQLSMNARLAQGERLRDMPEAWFTPPEDAAMANSMVAALGVICAGRLFDEHQFAKADTMMAHLLSIPSAMAGLHRHLLIGDRMYMELLGENRPEVIHRMLDENQQKVMKAMGKFISVLRTQYAHALLHEKDEKQAAVLLARFEKAAKSYPYPSDVLAERELIDLARARAEEQA